MSERKEENKYFDINRLSQKCFPCKQLIFYHPQLCKHQTSSKLVCLKLFDVDVWCCHVIYVKKTKKLWPLLYSTSETACYSLGSPLLRAVPLINTMHKEWFNRTRLNHKGLSCTCHDREHTYTYIVLKLYFVRKFVTYFAFLAILLVNWIPETNPGK